MGHIHHSIRRLWISWEHIDTLLSNIFREFEFQGTLVLYLNFQPVGSLPFNQSPWKETTCHEINHVLPSSLQWLHISRWRSTLPEPLEIPMMEWCEFRTLANKMPPYLFIYQKSQETTSCGCLALVSLGCSLYITLYFSYIKNPTERKIHTELHPPKKSVNQTLHGNPTRLVKWSLQELRCRGKWSDQDTPWN